MVERKSTSFRQEWWDSIQQYLKENPEEGFDPEDQTKDFIKNVMNRYTADSTVMFSEKELEMIKKS
mgnify:FL=1|jgi:hypothetical protein